MLGRLGQYEIAGIVGQGGMGVVLKSLDPALNRYVADQGVGTATSNQRRRADNGFRARHERQRLWFMKM